MQIECEVEKNLFFPAAIKDIKQQLLLLEFKKNNLLNGNYIIDRCQLVQQNSEESKFFVNQAVDLYQSNKNAFIRLKVLAIEGNRIILGNFNDSATPVGSADFQELRPLSNVRQLNGSSIKKQIFPVSNKLADKLDIVAETLIEYIPNIFLKVDKKTNDIEITCFDRLTVELIKDSSDMINGYAIEKIDPQKKMDNYITLQFNVEFDLLGRSLGVPQHTNIQEARKMPGIISISYEKAVNPRDPIVFTIVAENVESAEEARGKLQYLNHVEFIPSRAAGHIIGKGGKNLEGIKAQSKCHLINIGPQLPNQALRRIVYSGFRDQVDRAVGLVNLQLQHFQKIL
uniref:K Homology domain-containing protein n=1 Tax=Panagrolaimus sp. ES5 TaxID=591445 RepID=A0AC34FH45_9BILA